MPLHGLYQQTLSRDIRSTSDEMEASGAIVESERHRKLGKIGSGMIPQYGQGGKTVCRIAYERADFIQ